MSDATDAPPPSGEAGSSAGARAGSSAGSSTGAAAGAPAGSAAGARDDGGAQAAAAGGAPEARRRRRRRRRGGPGASEGADAQGDSGGEGDDAGDEGGGAGSGAGGEAAKAGGAPAPAGRRDERPQTGRPPREGREGRGPQQGGGRERPRQEGRGEGRSEQPRGEGRGEQRLESRGEQRPDGRQESRGGQPAQRPGRGQGGPESGRGERGGDRERRGRGGQPPAAGAGAAPGAPAPGREARREAQGNREGRRDGRDRDRHRGGDPRNQRRGDDSRDARADEDDDLSPAEAAQIGASSLTSEPREVLPRLGDRVAAPAAWDDDEDVSPSAEAKVEWGRDDDGPAAAVSLAPSLPAEAGDEADPSTQQLDLATDTRGPRGDVVSVIGVRFAAAGRVSLYDSGGAYYAVGEQVLVDGERGPRVGTVAVASERRTTGDRGLRRVMRLANAGDVERELPSAERARQALRLAKDRTAALNLPVKVFRAEFLGNGGRNDKLLLYITTEERIDLRDLLRDLGNATNARVELRQLGARDEAKAVGGIGSCGLTLCCTTWLPEFVPVSIKMAKDQGLVLNPQKVAGQCGRLKCCLVYEQAGYAELRKGLPKLGKRVISARGEGRVVEVDVLRQRVRVSYGPGESEVLPAGEVRPMFPSGNTPPSGRAGGRGPHDDSDDADDDAADSTDITDSAAPPDLTALADDPDAAAAPPAEPE